MKASYLDQSGKKVTLTTKQVQNEYKIANETFFNSVLPKVDIVSVASTKFLGCVSFKKSTKKVEVIFNSLQLTHSFTFSSYETFINTLIHEMVHVWQCYFSPKCLYFNAHGLSFSNWCAKIEKINPKIKITITSQFGEIVKDSRELFILVNTSKNCFIAFSEKTYIDQFLEFKETSLKRWNFKGNEMQVLRGYTTNPDIKKLNKLINRRSLGFQMANDWEFIVREFEIIDNFIL